MSFLSTSLCFHSFPIYVLFYFFFNYTATTVIYTYLHTLSLHDALPISQLIASTPETLREAVIDRLIDNVSVDQINKSNMIKVTAYSVSAEKAQRIANKLASVAMLHQIEKREKIGRAHV